MFSLVPHVIKLVFQRRTFLLLVLSNKDAAMPLVVRTSGCFEVWPLEESQTARRQSPAGRSLSTQVACIGLLQQVAMCLLELQQHLSLSLFYQFIFNSKLLFPPSKNVKINKYKNTLYPLFCMGVDLDISS